MNNCRSEKFSIEQSGAQILTLLLGLPEERHFCFMKAEISKSGFKPNQDRFFQADGFQTRLLENKQDA